MSSLNSSKLLITGDYPLIASPTLAKAFGVAAALFLQKLHYCLHSHHDSKIHQGHKYWFHSYEQWQQTLGIYSISTIKRIVSKLKQAGILVVAKLAKNKWLQTNFYRIDYAQLKHLIQPSSAIDSQNEEAITNIENTVAETESINSEDLTQPESSIQTLISIENECLKTIAPKVAPKELPLKIKVAAAIRPVAQYVSSTFDHSQGLNQPLQPHAHQNILQNMLPEQRCFYQALRQQRVDIHYDDQCIAQLYKYHQQVIRHIVYIKQCFSGFARYQWHTLEQLQMERYL